MTSFQKERLVAGFSHQKALSWRFSKLEGPWVCGEGVQICELVISDGSVSDLSGFVASLGTVIQANFRMTWEKLSPGQNSQEPPKPGAEVVLRLWAGKEVSVAVKELTLSFHYVETAFIAIYHTRVNSF